MATNTKKPPALEAPKTPGRTMNAIVIRAPGGPEVMEYRTVEEAKANRGEVLIRVVAAGVNKADCMQRKGNHPPPEGECLYPGMECSGVVEAIGPGVTKWKVGDEVRITKFVSTFQPPMGLVSPLGIVSVGNPMNT
jgi:NADPH:quinone reductase-like Zn-dependent oxidoreductase